MVQGVPILKHFRVIFGSLSEGSTLEFSPLEAKSSLKKTHLLERQLHPEKQTRSYVSLPLKNGRNNVDMYPFTPNKNLKCIKNLVLSISLLLSETAEYVYTFARFIKTTYCLQ